MTRAPPVDSPLQVEFHLFSSNLWLVLIRIPPKLRPAFLCVILVGPATGVSSPLENLSGLPWSSKEVCQSLRISWFELLLRVFRSILSPFCAMSACCYLRFGYHWGLALQSSSIF